MRIQNNAKENKYSLEIQDRHSLGRMREKSGRCWDMCSFGILCRL